MFVVVNLLLLLFSSCLYSAFLSFIHGFFIQFSYRKFLICWNYFCKLYTHTQNAERKNNNHKKIVFKLEYW